MKKEFKGTRALERALAACAEFDRAETVPDMIRARSELATVLLRARDAQEAGDAWPSVVGVYSRSYCGLDERLSERREELALYEAVAGIAEA